ncbi:sulfate adenylyltransferase [Oceanobacillus sp. CAU 1775]
MSSNTSIENKMNSYPQQPHGGTLINQVLKGKKLENAKARAKELPMIVIDLEAIITIEMIATGVLSPNKGFMNEADYKSVLTEGRLSNGVVWPVPLSFAPIGDKNKEIIQSLNVGDEIVLADDTKEAVAILKIDDIFNYDRAFRARHLFDTEDRDHPGVDAIYRRMGDTALGGTIELLKRVHWGPFEDIRMEPRDTWNLFYEEKKFKTVGGFITGANPLHRGHEYIHRNALEELDGLFVQPLVEMAKREYTRHEFRMLAYRSVLETYYPKERTILAPLRVTYIFAGPREAVLHALIMKNYGCTHALIGRDHAGIGEYYDKYASHTIFDRFTPEELGIDIRLFQEVFYCTRCDSAATEHSCPHDERYRINISGTGIRELLRYGMLPPKEIVRPESARIAMQGIQPKGIDSDKIAIAPVGKTIKSIFPYYLNRTRLGGAKREVPREVEQLTIEDLVTAITDVRENGDRIYKEIYEEYSHVTDINRAVQPEWVEDARETLHKHQEMVVDYLEKKVERAAETTSDEFMYQDKQEAMRELEVAKKILDDLPSPLRPEDLKYRTWNSLPYKRYRGSDE